jgi:hypothetical protein
MTTGRPSLLHPNLELGDLFQVLVEAVKAELKNRVTQDPVLLPETEVRNFGYLPIWNPTLRIGLLKPLLFSLSVIGRLIPAWILTILEMLKIISAPGSKI